jgi:hypothetical protein
MQKGVVRQLKKDLQNKRKKGVFSRAIIKTTVYES